MAFSEGLVTAPSLTAVAPLKSKSREDLILAHISQVKLIAKQINDRLPVSVGIDDLVSAGVLGLIAAIDRYDPKQRVKLRTFAEHKIRGAMLDSLRRMDWAPRHQRRRARLIEAAILKLEQKLQRRPIESEVAEELSLPIDLYYGWLSALPRAGPASLETIDSEETVWRSMPDLADYRASSPAQAAEFAEQERIVRDAIDVLPEAEKTVLSLYYYEEMTLREIARIINLHESRVSQLKSQAIARLRAAIAAPITLPGLLGVTAST